MKQFFSATGSALRMVLVMTLLLGFMYPLLTMSISQLIFNHRANGSLIERGGVVIGSSLLGQQFTSAKYFWGRPSASIPPYDAAASGGTNYGPANPHLIAANKERIALLDKSEHMEKARIPVDLVTASGSGLDPHISLDAALYQLPRVAHARGMKPSELKTLVENQAEKPGLGVFGKPFVNVLQLNLAVDEYQKNAAKEKR